MITQGLHHPHIVALMDILEIDNNTFATVLDFCDGPDLDTTLRESQVRMHACQVHMHACQVHMHACQVHMHACQVHMHACVFCVITGCSVLNLDGQLVMIANVMPHA